MFIGQPKRHDKLLSGIEDAIPLTRYTAVNVLLLETPWKLPSPLQGGKKTRLEAGEGRRKAEGRVG